METRIPVIGYEGIYEVSDLGRIKSLSRLVPDIRLKRGGSGYINATRKLNERILKQQTIAKGGYKRVRIGDRKVLVHRIVYCSFNKIPMEFKGWSNGVIMHINDKTDDNNISNLSFGTQQDNVKDCIVKGRWVNGVTKKNKIGVDDVEKIKRLYKEIKNVYKVGKMYGVSGATISRVVNNKIRVRKNCDEVGG